MFCEEAKKWGKGLKSGVADELGALPASPRHSPGHAEAASREPLRPSAWGQLFFWPWDNTWPTSRVSKKY